MTNHGNLGASLLAASNCLLGILLGGKGFAIFSRLSELLLLGMLLVRMLEYTLGEYVVKLLSKSDVSLLELGKTVHHHSILKVLSDHSFKHAQIVIRESAHASIQGGGD